MLKDREIKRKFSNKDGENQEIEESIKLAEVLTGRIRRIQRRLF